MNTGTKTCAVKSGSRAAASVLMAGLWLAALPATNTMAAPKPQICSLTTENLFIACNASVKDDKFVKKAICINISSESSRAACLDETSLNEKEGIQECKDQREWRFEACKLTGEGRYDPIIDPVNFESDYKNLQYPNPYFPLKVGNHWDFVNGSETDSVEVLDRTKYIQGVNAVVILDQVFQNGKLSESTNDWYGQAIDGTTWYFGEETGTLESYAGDNPELPELVSIDGSFKGGRNGDKAGTIFPATPHKDDVITEEASLGNAEDVTVFLSVNYSYGHDAELDFLVPQALADLFCSAGDCVVTKNFSLLEPGQYARKYYGRGIGVFLEVEVQALEAVQLVGCNFDTRCQNLPTP